MSHSRLHQIVRLREMLQKWRQRALTKAHSFSDLSIRRTYNNARSVHTRRSISMPSIRDGGSSGGRSTTAKVPAGHLAVYVGEGRRRFVIKMSYLSHPLFRALLKKTEEEIGFQSEGALALACEVAAFEQLLRIIQSSCKAHHRHSWMGEEPCEADEQQYEGLLKQLLESAEDLSQCALSTRAAHPLCNLTHSPLSQAAVS